MRYVSDAYPQINKVDKPVAGPASRQHQNCVPSVARGLVDIVTAGRIQVTATQVRRASGISDRRGLYFSEATEAVIKLTGGQVILEPRFLERANGEQRVRFRNRIVAGQACAVLIDTRFTAASDFATGTFRGLHCVLVSAYRFANGKSEYFVEDPGTTKAGWRWWPGDVLYRAAEAVPPGGGIWILAAPDTEGVIRRARAKGHVRAAPRVDAPSVRTVQLGRRYYVQETTRGGPWKTDAGQTAVGWHRVADGFIRGEGLQ